MERVAGGALRRCSRVKISSGSCRLRLSTSRKSCLASAICPGRNLLSTSTALPISNPAQSARRLQELEKRRPRVDVHHRTFQSSVQGTIGKGEAGAPDEALRTVKTLVAPEHLNEKEREIWDLLMEELQCTELEVQDISGGCGSMYGIDIVSEKFRGLNMLKQQRLVNQVLGEEIKKWHGVQLKTRAP
jgi:stress-induced morphogen